MFGKRQTAHAVTTQRLLGVLGRAGPRAGVVVAAAIWSWNTQIHPDPARIVRQAVQLYGEGRYRDSLATLDRSWPRTWESTVAFNRGNVHFKSGRARHAVEEYGSARFEEALRQAAVDYNRGNAQLREGELDRAIQDYVLSLKKRPADQDAKYNLELALLLKERSQRAAPPAVALTPADPHGPQPPARADSPSSLGVPEISPEVALLALEMMEPHTFALRRKPPRRALSGPDW